MGALSRLYQRRYPSLGGLAPEQARELARLTDEIGRRIGLLVDRRGRVFMVLVGDAHSIYIPELPRARLGAERLRGLRLVRTGIGPELVSQEDLMDMVFLRLDGVTVLSVTAEGEAGPSQHAHILPPGPDERLYELLDPEPAGRFTVDHADLIRALEEEFARVGADAPAKGGGRERALLVSVSTAPKPVQETALDELAALADTAGLDVAGRVVQRVSKVNPKFILGKGKLADLEVQALRGNADVVLFDQDLSPAQIRNLAEITERKVIDRTQLILDIFAQRATTRSGKLQVEMAQLKYVLPRLVGRGRAMSRLMGGVGGRGPGESKLEIDRRRARERLTRLKKELDKVRKRRGQTRERRAKAGLPIVSLVGYTNAGKSTLLNTLTDSGVLAEDKLFATLDPTSRRIRFPREQEVVLTDTVGFIRRLPPDLKEAFRATLEELESADVLVLVADAAHAEADAQIEAVLAILEEMELHELPRVLALNKLDLLSDEQRLMLANAYPQAVFISATDRASLEPLVERILDTLPAAPLVSGS